MSAQIHYIMLIDADRHRINLVKSRSQSYRTSYVYLFLKLVYRCMLTLRQICNYPSLKIPSHLQCVATLPC